MSQQANISILGCHTKLRGFPIVIGHIIGMTLWLLNDRQRQYIRHIYAAQKIRVPVLNRPAEVGETRQGPIRIADRLDWIWV